MPGLRVAISGCHRMLDRKIAGHNWAAAFGAVAETEIVAVHDRGAEVRERASAVWGVPAYDDYEQMLGRERPEIVCVATRQTLHAAQIEAAVAAGARGVVCEKPLATSMAEAARIARVCRDAGASFLLGLDRRWMPFYQHVGALLDDGLVGEVRTVASFGVPNLIAHGCHWFDVLAWFAGDGAVAWVSGTVDGEKGDPRDPPGIGVIQFVNGARAVVDSGGGTQVGFDIVGTRGRLTLLDDGAEVRLWTRNEAGKLTPTPFPPAPPPSDATVAAVRDLVGAHREGRPTACDLPAATRSLEIGLAFHASHARDGARVSFPLADRNVQVNSLPWGNE